VRPLSLNRYAYIENTPVSFSDHLGYVIKAMNMSGGGSALAKKAVSKPFAKASAATSVTTANRTVGRTLGAKFAKSSPSKGIVAPRTRSGTFTSATHPPCVLSYQACNTSTPGTPKLGKSAVIVCSTAMKVGMSGSQVAINQACGRAYADAYMKTQPQAVQDWYNASRTIDGILGPMTPLLTMGYGLRIAGNAPPGISTRPPQTSNAPTPQALRVGDVKIAAVPKGASGTRTATGKGMEYQIPSGTPELSPNVASIRIMDPVTTGKYTYPNGYAVYMNKSGQTIDPITGQTISNSHPFAHIPLS
jgi:hypothetical protein